MQTATFAAGCFWCVEAVFSRLKGVISVTSGYSGGTVANPSYKQVCTGTTGHAEVVQITYDEELISFPELLKVFFATHNPTTLNRQGNDVGTQYRSAVFFHNEQQKEDAKQAIAELQKHNVYDDPIVTTLEPFQTFYPAEAEHYEYYQRNPDQAYCSVVIRPKVEKFEQAFAEWLR